MNLAEKLAKRLATPDENGCMVWTGPKGPGGYGRLVTSRSDNPARNLRAHRVAWELHHGRPVPEGLIVRHSCDNRLCCTPGHLELGTPAQNSRDMVERQRQARGERNGQSKLTAGHVAVIRARLRAGHPHAQIAEDLGVSRSLVGLIGSRRLWHEVA